MKPLTVSAGHGIFGFGIPSTPAVGERRNFRPASTLGVFDERLRGGFVMAEEIVPVTKFKAACVALLDKVKSTGQPILVTREGEPIALISPPPRPAKPKSWLGSFKNKGRIVGDIVSPIADERDWEALRA